jgi:hypothetical protein
VTFADANEDALQRMRANGDDLSRPRDVDFTVVFPTRSASEKFAEHFRALGHKVSVEISESAENLPWDVVVVRHMALSINEIREFEAALESVATALSGRNDGWGCFSEPSEI